MVAQTNRRHERKRIDARISVEGEEIGGSFWFDTADVSAGGVYLKSDFLFEKGTRLALSFEAGETGRTFQIEGIIAWVNLGIDETMKNKPCGMGVEFLSMKREIKDILNSIISNEE